MSKINLKDFMDRFEISVDDMAILLGRTRRTVYNWLDGTHKIPAAASLLVKALDQGVIPFDWVIQEIRQNHDNNHPAS